MQKQLLITVGTTNFDSLIEKLDQSGVYEEFQKHGFTKIAFQYGNLLLSGKYKPTKYQQFSSLEVNCFEYTPNLIDYIMKADLIISHCGAGTILECLKLSKTMIGVVNTSLMDNHQIELFDAVVKRNYAYGIDNPEKITQELIGVILAKYDKKIEIISYPTPDVNAFDTVIASLYND